MCLFSYFSIFVNVNWTLYKNHIHPEFQSYVFLQNEQCDFLDFLKKKKKNKNEHGSWGGFDMAEALTIELTFCNFNVFLLHFIQSGDRVCFK